MDGEESDRVRGAVEKRLGAAREISSERLSKPSISPELADILKQRKHQRDTILIFSMKLTWASFGFLVLLISAQSLLKIWKGPAFFLLEHSELEILSVAVFGQIIGVIYIITRSLWDDRTYLEALKIPPP